MKQLRKNPIHPADDKPLIVGINLGDFGSTGSMMIGSLKYAHRYGGFDYLILTPNMSDKAPCVSFGREKVRFIERLIQHYRIKWGWSIDGDYFTSRSKKVISTVSRYVREGRRVIIHLHNIHHACLDVHYLLKHLVKMELPILYTLHDCWSFTGGCYHYEQSGCTGFQSGCKTCPMGYRFSVRRLTKKVRPLLGSGKVLLLPCSEWLSRELGKSMLSRLPRMVVPGETSLIPVPYDRELRSSLDIPEGHKILVSVNKGFQHLRALAEILPSDYHLIVFGCDEYSRDARLICMCNLIHEEYAKYLSIADCFVSTTPEDTLPLALMEAQLSGLPIVGFGHGGTPELITEKTGIMVGVDDDVHKLLNAIIYVLEEKPFSKSDILANGNKYKKDEYAKRMLPVYESIVSSMADYD